MCSDVLAELLETSRGWSLSRTHGRLRRFSVPESVVLSEMTRVAAEGRLVKGSVQGVTFTPASFTHAQSSKVHG